MHVHIQSVARGSLRLTESYVHMCLHKISGLSGQTVRMSRCGSFLHIK